ncbi:DNA replication factor Cdt1-like [Clytia hemisphaerica]
MAQTTVNQFFVARKSNLPFHPSKKRKVDGTDIELNPPICKKRTTTRSRGRPVKQKATTVKKNALPAPQVVNEVKEQKKEIPQSPKKTLIAIDSVISKSPVGKIKVNNDINEQAKTILHSRGNAILQSSFQGKALTSPAKASEVLLAMSPNKKKKEKLELTIKKPVVEDGLKSRRELLRKKYSNLLDNAEAPKSSTTDNKIPIESNNKLEELKESSRNRLRNKYKHLLNKESSTATSSKDVKVETTSFPSQKTISSPQKAHEKYKHLTEKNVTSTFQLPQKYKLLLEMFRCADSVLFLLQQRSEICTFDRLKKSVQSMCGREFNQKHLATMKTVYPTGFVFRQERGLYTASGDGKTNNYQLSIEADYKDLRLPTSSIKNNSSILITRRLKFESKLLALTKAHHQKFLRKLNLKIDDNEIHRWHPHFKVEDVPDIEQSALPKPPITKSFSSAADLLLKNKFAPKVADALNKASEETSSSTTASTEAKPSTSTSTASSSTKISKNQGNILKSVSSDLLERIRQKEQKKIELAMTRNPKQELRLSRMERLPDVSRIIKAYFVAEKKAAITLEDCVQKLSESYGTDLHRNNLEEHVRLIAEVVPKWLQILPVRKCMYVKLAKNFDINNVINTLADVKKKEEIGAN